MLICVFWLIENCFLECLGILKYEFGLYDENFFIRDMYIVSDFVMLIYFRV